MQVVIIGAGHAGATLALALRQQGFDGDVVLVGEEPVPPYQRPPLSKQLLQRDTRQPLQDIGAYAASNVDLRLGTTVAAIDTASRSVTLADGAVLGYDRLVIATGASPRLLGVPGVDGTGVLTLRNDADREALSARVRQGGRLVVVGGGWIGLEVASSARVADVEVTVLEREDRLLARVASPELASHVEQLHRGRGVDVRLGADLVRVVLDDRGDVAGVELADGEIIACRTVLIAVGAVPRTDLAVAAGIGDVHGVPVDEGCRTRVPDVFAIGDVTVREVPGSSSPVRVESIPSAIEQARVVAGEIVGSDRAPAEIPWFWSEHYGETVQICGLRPPGAKTIARGDGVSAPSTFLHVLDERLVAAEVVARPADFIAARKLVAAGEICDLDALGDAARPLVDAVVTADPAVVTPRATEPTAAEPVRPAIVFVLPDGTEQAVEVDEGQSVMEAALMEDLPGVIAECGGLCTCGTCHVHVEEEWFDRLPPADDFETETLELAHDVCPTSRLSCQLVMTCELAGLRVRLLESP